MPLGKNVEVCHRAVGGEGGGFMGWADRSVVQTCHGVLALMWSVQLSTVVWSAWGGGGEGCVCVSGQVALCDGKASWLLPCGHLLVGTAALVAVVWARLLCQDCASVWSLPILSLLSIAEGLLFSVVGCWLECLQKQNWTVVQDEYHLYGVQENGMECCIAEVERVIAKHEIEEILAKEKVREDELCCLQESFKYLHKLDKKNNTIAWGSIADFIIAVAKEMDPEG